MYIGQHEVDPAIDDKVIEKAYESIGIEVINISKTMKKGFVIKKTVFYKDLNASVILKSMDLVFKLRGDYAPILFKEKRELEDKTNEELEEELKKIDKLLSKK